jgi:hypothetical protein
LNYKIFVRSKGIGYNLKLVVKLVCLIFNSRYFFSAELKEKSITISQ